MNSFLWERKYVNACFLHSSYLEPRGENKIQKHIQKYGLIVVSCTYLHYIFLSQIYLPFNTGLPIYGYVLLHQLFNCPQLLLFLMKITVQFFLFQSIVVNIE